MSPATNPKPSVFIGPIIQVQELKKFLITGHGRSGTHYMAQLFTSLGHPVGAQTGGQFGMSHNFPGFFPFSEARKEYEYIIQVVRNPVLVVESTFRAIYSLPKQNSKKISEILRDGFSRGTPNNRTSIERTIYSVVLWNRAIRSANPDLVVQVENAPAVCEKWLEDHGYKTKKNDYPPPTNINHRHNMGWHLKKPVPWNELGEDTKEIFRKHCREYGYPDNIP